MRLWDKAETQAETGPWGHAGMKDSPVLLGYSSRRPARSGTRRHREAGKEPVRTWEESWGSSFSSTQNSWESGAETAQGSLRRGRRFDPGSEGPGRRN